VRAAYAALILGIASGLILATGVLSGGSRARPATVAATLALDAGVDIDRRRAEAVAVLVARCMARYGFSWEPWVEPAPSPPDADVGPVEWAERWGFGISTTAGLRQPALAGDPNLARLGSMGPDERDALRAAMHGTGQGGCQAGATAEVYGLRDRLIAPLRPALDELETRIAADPAAGTVLAGWRRCVAPVAGGLVLDRRRLPAALMTRVSDRLAALGSTTTAVAGLAALQAEERLVAATLAGCETAFSAGRTAVAAPHEAAFVADHEQALDAIGVAIRDAEASLPTLPP
jgi:hypothetical protein